MKRAAAAGAVLAFLVLLAVNPAGAQTSEPGSMDIQDVSHLSGDRWRAVGQASDDECRAPHRVGVMEASFRDSGFPEDTSGARTIGRVEGDWSLEFEASFPEIWVVLFCDHPDVPREFSRAIAHGERSGAPAGGAPAGTGGAPLGLVAGGVGVAILVAAGALVMRARRPARREGHAACIARHAAASKRVTVAKAQATAAVATLDAELEAARGAFDVLLDERNIIEAVVDDYVRRSDG